jgi:hypothetical protein
MRLIEKCSACNKKAKCTIAKLIVGVAKKDEPDSSNCNLEEVVKNIEISLILVSRTKRIYL